MRTMEKMKSYFGHVGNGFSIVCAIHCLAMPVLLSVLPAVGMLRPLGASSLVHGWLEYTLLGSALGFSLLSLCWGYFSHKKVRAFAFFAAALLWFCLGQQTHQHVLSSLMGGVCLIAANLTNRNLCMTCSHCKEHSHEQG